MVIFLNYIYLLQSSLEMLFFSISRSLILAQCAASWSSRFPLPDFMTLTKSLRLSKVRFSKSSSTSSPQMLSKCSKFLHSSDCAISSYFRQYAPISTPALNMQSLSYGGMLGKNYPQIFTMSSSTFQHRLVSFLLADFSVQFSVISYQITAKQPSDILSGLLQFLLIFFILFPITTPSSLLLGELMAGGRKSCRAANIIYLLLRAGKMKHAYSKSMGTMPRNSVKISQVSTQTGRQSLVKLPGLKNKSSANLLHRSLKNKEKKNERIEVDVIEPYDITVIEKVRQKSKLLGMLKQKIMECGDNLFIKKLLSEIKFTSLGRAGQYIWERVQQFEKCDQELLERVYHKYQLKITDESLRTMDFINNVCRFMLADYKRKRWMQKEREVSEQVDKNKSRMREVGRKLQDIETPQTKLQIMLSLAGMKQECSAKKQCYLNWKQRAIEKLKSNQVKCSILRAEIFTQGFY